MKELSKTQQKVLTLASQSPAVDIRTHMGDLKSPAVIRQVVNSMLNNGLITEVTTDGDDEYFISDYGYEAIGAERPVKSVSDDAVTDDSEEESQAAEHTDDAPHTTEAPAEEGAADEPEEVDSAADDSQQGETAAQVAGNEPAAGRVSKKQLMIDMLSRDEGATHQQLMAALKWKTHSVYGSRSSLNKELMEKRGLTIISEKGADGVAAYRIVKYDPAQPATDAA